MKRVLLGMLTPSSNTSLEPLISGMVAGVAGVTAHFSRFPVTEIALDANVLAQFDDSKILDAAMLLAHAKVDVIAWNGTSGGWLGFDADERLCRRITDATGIPATTSVLALNEALRLSGTQRFALVTPYLDDVQARVIGTYRNAGFDCVAEEHLKLRDNFSFSEVTGAQLDAMVARVASARPGAISTFCTNLNAAHRVPDWERRHGIPIYDTVSTALWQSMRMAGVKPALVKGWGKLFDELN
jgi:maleate isomerase